MDHHDCCKKDHHRRCDCDGRRRRTVSVQCAQGNCFEVRRPNCGPCDHLFKHHFDRFHRDCGCDC